MKKNSSSIRTDTSTKEIITIGTPSQSSEAVRASALSALTPKHFTRRGIPEYIGSDSLRSVFTIDTCATSTAPVGVNDHCSSKQYDQQDHSLEDHEYFNNTVTVTSDECPCSSDFHPEKDHHGAGQILLSPSNWVWKVEASLLPSVPQHAPLERASLRIRDLPVDTIAARISDFLRINSISSSYPTEEPGRVDCLTSSCIKFVVQLWKDEDENGIVVEVQRRRGCGIRMRYLRRCLYKCILSGDGPCRNCCEINLRRPSKVLEKQICNELYAEAPNIDDEEQSKRRRSSNGQLVCVDLLESEKMDEKRLGVEYFLGMTDPNNESSHEIARALLYNEGSIASRLRQAFLHFLRAKLPTGDGDVDWSNDVSTRTNASDDASVFEVPFLVNTELGDAHVLALTALVNCLESVDAHERDYLTNDASKLKVETPFWAQVLQVLVYDLHEFSHQPLEAALSAKCLRILENLEPERFTPFIGTSVAPLLKTAHEFGKAHHLSLEKESKELVLRFCSEEEGHEQRALSSAASSSSCSSC
jgi:hypothetical protein